MSLDRPIELSIDGGTDEWARLNHALATGEIDEAEWFARYQAVLVPAYLGGDNPRAQSGHSGDEARWEAARRPVLEAVDAPGDLLDVGCASGYLMESLHRWSGGTVEPYGLEVSPELADLARRRLPHWVGRIWTGNALRWTPPDGRRFTYVRTGLDYVPPGREGDYLRHLLDHVVGRRLIVGVYNEAAADNATEELAAGHQIAGRREWPKPDDLRVVRRVYWIDRCYP